MAKISERTADRKCCNCGTNCDSKSNRIPVNVTPADDAGGRRELFCPRCFVWLRMHREPERFNASCTLAVVCQFCGAESVCFAASRQGAFCSACGKGGAMPIRPSKEDMEALFAAVRDAAEEAGVLRDVRK